MLATQCEMQMNSSSEEFLSAWKQTCGDEKYTMSILSNKPNHENLLPHFYKSPLSEFIVMPCV